MSVAAPAPRTLLAPVARTLLAPVPAARALVAGPPTGRTLAIGAPTARTLVAGAPYTPVPAPDAPTFDPDSERAIRSQLATSARELVASALIAPILEEFRASQPQGGLFGVSQAESRFGPILDAELADAMVRRGGFRIERDVEAAMLRRAGLKPETAPALPKALPEGGVLA